jgi:hypothetical protein
VVSSFPLGDILHNRDANGRVVKWSVELGALSIEFTPRSIIKSQALADFIAEWTEIQDPPPNERLEHWVMYSNGAHNLYSVGAGILFISPRGEQLNYVLQLLFKATNNAAEYEALIHASGSPLSSALSDSSLMVTPRSLYSKSTRTGIRV